MVCVIYLIQKKLKRVEKMLIMQTTRFYALLMELEVGIIMELILLNIQKNLWKMWGNYLRKIQINTCQIQLY